MPAQKAAKKPRAGKSHKGAGRSASPKAGSKGTTKKFRLGPERARIVEQIAKKEKKTESEVLREGIDLLERVRARRKHVPELLDFVKDHRPPQTKFRLK